MLVSVSDVFDSIEVTWPATDPLITITSPTKNSELKRVPVPVTVVDPPEVLVAVPVT